jgi:hypothetical protein
MWLGEGALLDQLGRVESSHRLLSLIKPEHYPQISNSQLVCEQNSSKQKPAIVHKMLVKKTAKAWNELA